MATPEFQNSSYPEIPTVFKRDTKSVDSYVAGARRGSCNSQLTMLASVHGASVAVVVVFQSGLGPRARLAGLCLMPVCLSFWWWLVGGGRRTSSKLNSLCRYISNVGVLVFMSMHSLAMRITDPSSSKNDLNG